MSNWMGASGTKLASTLLAWTTGEGAAAPTGTDLCRETQISNYTYRRVGRVANV